MSIIQILLAIFLPPVSVLLQKGLGLQFVLHILLTLCFGLPGMIHAIYLLVTDKA